MLTWSFVKRPQDDKNNQVSVHRMDAHLFTVYIQGI